ncbi:MAG TPA: RNA polymerase sigma factor [Rhizomicrobium sp.]|jgi:RNA polymerase sigma factor (sigma-70 family)|nr:RNA polymerase sigma factor [Rhizomicrobium sp.]
MAEKPEDHQQGAKRASAIVAGSALKDWFVREVLPLESALMQYLQNSCRDKTEIADLRQEVYVRVYEAAREQIPRPARPFVFTVARNLLINRVRRERIVTMESVVDLDALDVAIDMPGPDRSAIARDELRRLQLAIERLPARCREAVTLGRIEGLSGQEIARRMGISEAAVSKHLAIGMNALANILYGERSEKKP